MCSMIVVMINAMYMINDKYDMVSWIAESCDHKWHKEMQM